MAKLWWKAKTLEGAMGLWMATQDRSGIDWGPAEPVPAGQSGVDIEIVAPGWVAAFQTARFVAEVSYNGPLGPWEDNGQVSAAGGVVEDKQGNPANRGFVSPFNPNHYPTHVRVRHEIPGTIACGFNRQFSPVA